MIPSKNDEIQLFYMSGKYLDTADALSHAPVSTPDDSS